MLTCAANSRSVYLVDPRNTCYMSKRDLKDLSTANEIDLTVKGRNSGQDISRPVWFVHEDDKLYLLPVQGSVTNWYRNVLKNPNVKISVQRQELNGKARTITDDNKVKKIVEKFRSKYGNSDIQKYYSKFDVGIEFPLKL
jgi:deazaflavin-dependent oxidoreductase (nitroreductase family)